MKLIIESGATKSNWIVLNGQEVLESTKLEGINATSNPESLNYISDFKSDFTKNIKKIYFYGAGVSNASAIASLKREFSFFFPAATIDIQHDILAAARSVSHNQHSIVSILGTGTNTVLFDGTHITYGLKALGYLFSDFGSGFHIGKEIILRYYRDQMDDADKQTFESRYISKNPNIHYDIYQLDKPNKVIAQYSKFLNDCSKEFRNLILQEVFQIFFERQIMAVAKNEKYKLNFVGSVAHAFSNKLTEIAESNNFEINNIVADPIEGLIQYHRSQNE